jgi:hypothetical protein
LGVLLARKRHGGQHENTDHRAEIAAIDRADKFGSEQLALIAVAMRGAPHPADQRLGKGEQSGRKSEQPRHEIEEHRIAR